jgi:hypothetical protein
MFSIVSQITFHFGEQIFSPGKATKQAYSVLYNCFGNEAGAKKMPSKWKVICDTMLRMAELALMVGPLCGILAAIEVFQ